MRIRNITFIMILFYQFASSETDYYPLKIGNYWKYKGIDLVFNNVLSIIVQDTIRINSKLYFKMLHSGESPDYGTSKEYELLRKDSLGNILEYNINDNSECILYRLSNKPDSMFVWHRDSSGSSISYDYLCYNWTEHWWGRDAYIRIIGMAHDTYYFTNNIGLCAWYMPDYLVGYDMIECFLNDTLYSDIEEKSSMPYKFDLNVYPNPFNSSINILYSINENNDLIIKIFDIHGKLVETLNDLNRSLGLHTKLWKPQKCSSGQYIICLISKDKILTKKVLYIK